MYENAERLQIEREKIAVETYNRSVTERMQHDATAGHQ
jgi:hypothetical protein